MTRSWAFIAVAGSMIVAGCQGFGEAMTAHKDVVARVPGHELTVDDAAGILAQNAHLPAQPEVVEALANLWVDYMLLAKAASGDSPLATIDIDALLRPYAEQELVRKLGERVLDQNAELSDEDLRRAFDEEQPGLEVNARHILLRVAPDATGAQRDAVRTRAEELRERLADGEDFAELAREHSDDTGSREDGGSLGFFQTGEMVAPFEEAAFALDVGELSEVVETPFGYHIITVDERRLPEFDEIKESYREQQIAARQQDAEERYIRSLTDPLDIRVQDGAYDVARELARKPDMQLGGRAGARALVSYDGGAFTAREFQREMSGLPPGIRARYAAVGDEQIEAVLRRLTERKLLVAEANRVGIALSDEERERLETEAREHLERVAEAGGLLRIEPQEGETLNRAIERKVISLMGSIVRNERDGLLPLDPLFAAALRQQASPQIQERAFQAVVARFQTAQAEQRAAEERAAEPAEAESAEPR